MSLKKYKNKSELIEDDIDQFELNPFKSCGYYWWNSFYFHDYDDYYYDDYYDEYYYDDGDDYYESLYSSDEINNYLSSLNWKVVNKSYGKWNISSPSRYGDYINMESIYGKIEKRNRRIDIVLGLMKDDKYTPTIGDLYPNLK
jgi:hypothetical protein